jgi:phage FluMu protein Com
MDNVAFIVPIQVEFCGEIRTIYAVNVERPDKHWGSHITFSEQCPHCKERHFYRVYDPIGSYEINGYAIERYILKCPSCKGNFYFEDKMEIDE